MSETEAKFPFESILSSKGRELLRRSVRQMDLKAGITIISEGDICERLVMVKKGAIRVSKVNSEGRDMTLYMVQPGEICLLGLQSLATERTYPAWATSLENTSIDFIPADVFRELFREEAGLRQFAIDFLSRQLAVLTQRLEETAFQSVDQKLAAFLLEGHEASSSGAPLTWTHQEVADRLSTAREVVSRTLSSFEKRGWIEAGRKMIRVKQPETIREFLKPSRPISTDV